jgi:glutamine synthetase
MGPPPMTDRAALERRLADDGTTSVRLVGTNHDGLILGKHLSPPKFLAALDGGTVMADTAFGVDFSGEVAVGWDWGGWRGEVSDIRLVPDPATLTRDPARETWATAIGNFTDMDGQPLPACYRGLLQRQTARLAELGYTALVAPELEFMVFEQSIQEARAQGYRDLVPLGGPGRITYLMTRSPDLTAFVDATTRRLDALGVQWDYWSSETAPGQVEINLAPADPIATADAVTRTKLALREIAEEQGRSVTFMAYGIDPHLGGGTHVNLSLQKDGENAFRRTDHGGHSELLRRFVAGLLATLPGAMSFFTPTVNSYRRLVEITGPPTTVTWGEDNKSVAVRTATSEPKASRVEHRVPSGDCNMYLAIAAILAGGMIGIEDELEPPPEYEGMAWGLPPDAAPRLPHSLPEAAEALRGDVRMAEMLGPGVVEYWLGSRAWELRAFRNGGGELERVGEFELLRYFEQT